MERALLNSVDSIVGGGNAVISADDSVVVAVMQETRESGRSATFYVSPAQGAAMIALYWTPARIKQLGMEPVTAEEITKIESELAVQDSGFLYSNRIECTCGHTYGAFEFMQQGIREHGRETVEAALTMENTFVMRINPSTTAVCSNCSRTLLGGHYYICRKYGCCLKE